MMTRRRFLVLVGGAAPIVAGAAAGIWLLPGEDANADLPSVRWNEHSCAHCGMVISDRRYAAAWIEDDGEQLRFDDVGCMVMNLREHPPARPARFFVRDFAGEDWLDAAGAVYFKSAALHSPMAYGVAAFADKSAVVAESGDPATDTWTWDELVDGLEGMKRDEHDESHAA